ncbi:endoplasmic reticulum protein SC65-like [Engraulis encrasicolus]|uniref:endoplasmic reticulum protein SC65-like n=1 Tax=Engraulis encrasicolus TaxID=184585 RepID=UPI002FD1C5ED
MVHCDELDTLSSEEEQWAKEKKVVEEGEEKAVEEGEDGEVGCLGWMFGVAQERLWAGRWGESARLFELSLRLHRLIWHSLALCCLSCREEEEDTSPPAGLPRELQLHWAVLRRAGCVGRCWGRIPGSCPPPSQQLMTDFRRREPYRYLHLAYRQLNESARAASAAHTYLQRNPEDLSMTTNLRYHSNADTPGEPDDLEERPYERAFLQAVFLFNGGEWRKSALLLEEALLGYQREHQLCTAACDIMLDTPSHSTVAEVYGEVLHCSVSCEDDLRPCVGGAYVDNFLPTIYHHLQFCYYKMEEFGSAVACAASFLLFEPQDQLMRDNMEIYKTHQEQWRIHTHHYTPRSEAVDYWTLISSMKEMLQLTRPNLHTHQQGGPDVEFSGEGGREERLQSHWEPPLRSRGDHG